MAIEKTSLTYVFSKDSDTAKYLEFLIDKVRGINYIDFKPICIEDHKATKSKIAKLQSELDNLTSTDKVTAKDFVKAMDTREEIERYKIADRYKDLSPALIFNYGLEDEVTLLGTKMSLSKILDIGTKVHEGAKMFSSLDLSGFETVIKEVAKVATVAIENNAGEGLETTQ